MDTRTPVRAPAPAWRFKLLYDGACPFCLREVRLLQRLDRAGHLAFEDVTAAGFEPRAYGATREELLGVIHGVYPDGRVVKRLPVFREAYAQVGRGWLLAPTGWPLLRPLADGAYELFARNRVRLGRLFGRKCPTDACELGGRRPLDRAP